MRFGLSKHAQQQVAERRTPSQSVQDVLVRPEQIVPEHSGRKAYQSQLVWGGRLRLLCAIVDDHTDPAVVITVYQTTRIGKYWRETS